MNVTLITPLPYSKSFVQDNFEQELFDFLAPPSFAAKTINYEGNRPGNLVHLHFKFPINQDWISEIESENDSNQKYEFIDFGVKLPLGLKSWRHIHTIRSTGENTCEVIDDMTFDSKSFLLKPIHYMMIVLGFAPRKKLYPKFFKQLAKQKL